MQDNKTKLFVVIPTTGTNQGLLFNRALSSLIEQKGFEKAFVVCDCKGDLKRFKDLQSADLNGIEGVEFVLNDRTKGISGALNTGIMRVLKENLDNIDNTYIAFLDDDDRWSQGYLDAVLHTIEKDRPDVIASNFIRIEGTVHDIDVESESIIKMFAPDGLNRHEFFVTNPGIQGSNLTMRLKSLLEAGMFDEYLPSTTDRDLMIRVAQLPGVRYSKLEGFYVTHFADRNRVRLSSPENPAKCTGLRRFWQKYGPLMMEDERKAFKWRATNVFKCDIESGVEDPDAYGTEAGKIPQWMEGIKGPLPRVNLVVAQTVDEDRVDNIEQEIDMAIKLFLNPGAYGLRGVTYIVLKNGWKREDSEKRLKKIADRFRKAGGRWIEAQTEQRLYIAQTRNIIQSMALELARTLEDPVVWIKDDGLTYDNLGVNNNELFVRVDTDLIDRIRRLYVLYKQGMLDVGIGGVTQAPPIPAASTLRTELLDLYYNLGALLNSEPMKVQWMDPMMAYNRWQDYYYDLSHAHTDHVEVPVKRLTKKGQTDLLKEIISTLDEIAKGNTPFRPLLQKELLTLEDTVYRGGNTIVFNLDALMQPNPEVRVNGTFARRSDMEWAIVLRNKGFKIKKIPVFLRHDRSIDDRQVDYYKLVRDIWGAGGYKAYQRVGIESKQEFIKQFKHLVMERTVEFIAAAYRSLGLIGSIKGLIKESSGKLKEDEMGRIQGFLNQLGEEIIGGVELVLQKLEKTQEIAVKTYNSFKHVQQGDGGRQWDYSTMVDRGLFMDVREVLKQNAAGDLRVLGRGNEGIVVTDNKSVFKCIRQEAIGDKTRRLIKDLKGRKMVGPLYPVIDVIDTKRWFVVQYPFEELRPYNGGLGPQIIKLMWAFKRQGIVSRNFAPWNLGVNEQGEVKFFDIGRDVVKYDELEFELMVRRAYLTWKLTGKVDNNRLRILMRKSLQGLEFDEMDGYERFRRAARGPGKEDLLDDLIVERFRGRVGRVFDYGCGKGKLGVRFMDYPGAQELVLYDIKPDGDWERLVKPFRKEREITLLRNRQEKDEFVAKNKGRFDVVLNILVLCVVEDEREFNRIIQDLADLVREDGRVVVAVCNPERIGGVTLLQERIMPDGVSKDERFVWRKRVFSTNRIRQDFHRTLKDYLRGFERHGLKVVERFESESVNLETFGVDSDFMVFILKKGGNE